MTRWFIMAWLRGLWSALVDFFQATSEECVYQQDGCTGRNPCPFCERDILNGEYRR